MHVYDPKRTFRQSSLVSGGTVQQAVALIGHTEVNVYPLPVDIRRLINREIFSAGSSHRGPCCRTQRAIGLGHRSRLCRRGFERGDASKATRIKMKALRTMMNPMARSTMVISLRPCVSPRNPWLNQLRAFPLFSQGARGRIDHPDHLKPRGRTECAPYRQERESSR